MWIYKTCGLLSFVKQYTYYKTLLYWRLHFRVIMCLQDVDVTLVWLCFFFYALPTLYHRVCAPQHMDQKNCGCVAKSVVTWLEDPSDVLLRFIFTLDLAFVNTSQTKLQALCSLSLNKLKYFKMYILGLGHMVWPKPKSRGPRLKFWMSPQFIFCPQLKGGIDITWGMTPKSFSSCWEAVYSL